MDIVLKYFSDFTSTQLEQYRELEHLYKEWNQKINVISRKDIDHFYERHVLHSLSIAAVIPFPDQATVTDLGSGGGFPGIPLAIFYPDVQFHLVDSIAKKLKVADAVVTKLGLRNVTMEHNRIENCKSKPVDFVVSRAVAPLKDLWKWSRPFIKKVNPSAAGPVYRGLICLKGGDLHTEIQESGTRPVMTSLNHLYSEPFFNEKYLLFVPRK